MKKPLLLTACCLLLTVYCFAQPGTPDSDFDADGFSIIAIDDVLNDYGYAAAINSTGKIILAGSVGNSGNYQFALARLNPDGSFDNTFSTDGKTTTTILNSAEGRAVALQSDGKILVAGISSNNTDYFYNFTLVRYKTNGSQDETFDVDGIAFTSFNAGVDEMAMAVAVQTDGKILVGGSSNGGVTAFDFALARFNTDGSLDNTFSFDGKTTTDFGSSDFVNTITLQPDGKILAAGYSNLNGFQEFTIARYNTDGSLDNTFSTDGKYNQSIVASTYDKAFNVLVQPDGKILLTGIAEGAYADIALLRLNANGTPDNTFGTGGSITYDISGGYTESATSALLQPDGKIVIAGFALPGVTIQQYLMRLNTDGSVDSSFATYGVYMTASSNYQGEFKALVLQSDLKIIAAGYNSSTSGNVDFLAARFLSGLNLGVLEFTATASALIYPNPVNETTTLGFELTSIQTLDINLYDAQGRVVKSITQNKTFNAGKHEVAIDATQLASGQYTLVIENNTGKTTVRLQK